MCKLCVVPWVFPSLLLLFCLHYFCSPAMLNMWEPIISRFTTEHTFVFMNSLPHWMWTKKTNKVICFKIWSVKIRCFCFHVISWLWGQIYLAPVRSQQTLWWWHTIVLNKMSEYGLRVVVKKMVSYSRLRCCLTICRTFLLNVLTTLKYDSTTNETLQTSCS